MSQNGAFLLVVPQAKWLLEAGWALPSLREHRGALMLIQRGWVMLDAEGELRRITPVYVNSYNMPTYLGRIVLSLRENGFENIIVLDQASSNPDVSKLLLDLEVNNSARVRRMKVNRGPRYFFDALHYRKAGRHFIYTDPDIELPDPMPVNFLTRLIGLSNTYKIGKVGCALDISDSHLFDDLSVRQEASAVETTVIEHEQQYWLHMVEPDVYRADVDTTFALYNVRWFRIWHFMKALRVAGPWTIKHRPWYLDKRLPANELTFYKESAKFSSWFNSSNGGALFRETPVRFVINRVKAARWRYWQLKSSFTKRA